jgi:membrane-bound inhibitor of C-type lysozyme
MRNQFIEDKDRGFIVRKKINEDFLKLFVYTDSPFLSSNGLTLNYLPKYNNDHALINSVVYDDGSNVGIGTSNPLNATGYTSLTINSPTNGGRVDLQKNGTQFGLIYSAGSNLMDIEAIGSNNIRFNTNLTNRMFISSSGNVGIGTSTPNEKLTVVGGISASGNVYANSLRIRDSRHIGDDNFSVTWDSGLSGTQVSIGGLSGSYMDFSTPLTNDYNLRIGSYIYSGGEWNGIGTGPTEKRNLTFLTCDATRMAITSSGNVGIGTNTPSDKLTVNGNILAANNIKSTVGMFSNGEGDEYILFDPNTDSVSIGANSTVGIFLESTSNVGIGTSSPIDKLSVNGTIYIEGGTSQFNPSGVVDSGNLTNTYLAFGAAGAGSDWAYLRQIGGSNTYNLSFDLHDDGNSSSGGQSFSIRSVGSSSVPDLTPLTRFHIDGEGNVGIGTSTPNEKLTVVGGISATGTLYSGNIYLNRGDTSREGGQINFNRAKDNTTSFAIDVYSDTIGSTDSRFRFIDTVSNTERMTMLSGGNVGIGTSAPNEKLTVVGGISATGDISLNTSSRLNLGTSSTATSIRRNAGFNGIDFIADNLSRMFIGDIGNVGIGTSTPNEKLTVVGNISASGNVYSKAFRAVQGIPNNNDSSTNGYSFGIDGDTGLFSPITTTGGAANGGLALYSNNTLALSANHTTTYFKTDVGIGTISPQRKLHVNGTIRLEGLPTYSGNSTAIAGGLSTNDVYKTSTGELRIVV